MTETRTFTVAGSFYYDHAFRDLPAGTVVREAGKRVVVELDAAGYDSLLNDATYYAEHMTDPSNVDEHTLSLSRSAVRVVNALKAAPWPESAGAEDAWDREQLAKHPRV